MKTGAPLNVTRLLIAWGQGDRRARTRLRRSCSRTCIVWRRVKWLVKGLATSCSRRARQRSLRPARDGNSRVAEPCALLRGRRQIMRRILVDVARARCRDKRGGNALQVSFSDVARHSGGPHAGLVALDDALRRSRRSIRARAKSWNSASLAASASGDGRSC